MKLLVVGAGEMGRWLADSLAADIAFADADPETARAAAADRHARVVAADTDERFEAVALAVPMSAVDGAIREYAPLARRAMFDVSGVMAGPLSTMASALPDGERGSFHPLFAPPRAPGNVAYVPDTPGPVLDSVRSDIAAAGNEVFETTAEEHDEAMETVQAAAHTAVLAYGLAAEDVRPEFETPVSSGLKDLVETVTEGSPRVYAEIQETFDGAENVAAAAEDLAGADRGAFADLYRRVREAVGTERR